MTNELTADQMTLVEKMMGNSLRGVERSQGKITCTGNCPADRYLYDFDLCPHEEGWEQFDTTQDASYFGIWCDSAHQVIVEYQEGDVHVTFFLSEAAYKSELKRMAEVYGPPPPACKGIDVEIGSVTHFYCKRPE